MKKKAHVERGREGGTKTVGLGPMHEQARNHMCSRCGPKLVRLRESRGIKIEVL